ncbi:MAG: HicB_like antitoxin of bacterial toxin-antitoxin system (plasmid) [Candidatus Fermentimicrarchaeum limneticum]|uniref:HicB_like antitoxin of bacterial toxin-antitoxin system n=1 Tax=Fermentimicrarchaeum limneticum TaxID=2795018 RepID=A0A7D5XDP6_FERL1|nr:MAG: HicB_like antitoxin of bacterial toxin-antitoxin system [Candidatus Fermentimicrarchaeum limneticum]
MDEEFENISISIPKQILKKIDSKAEEARRTRSSEITLRLEKSLEVE